ncbi:CrcB family protein [Nocardioides agariphilus]|uniref:Fluoride-specific ion channel FluC n=1 Tax=Nocardioides agariphilus TaxID=433664 RepID=A0A930VNF0_9ACTN|nr:CrcB family protein [Nocardioides agariphilus]
MTPLLVALGAAVGATSRFLAAHYLDRRTPWGTLLVNVAGSFVLGVLFGAGVSAHALALLGTGLCGGLTTYSAFAVQTRDQARRGLAIGAAYGGATIVASLAACACGFALGQA